MEDRERRTWLVTAAATGAILLTAAVAMASNTAFRFQKTLVLAGSGTIGDNWVSLPFSNPYGTAAALCSKAGLVMHSDSPPITGATITVVDGVTGAASVQECGSPGAASLVIPVGAGIRIRQPNVAGAKTKIVLSGAHNPAVSITIPKKHAGGAYQGYWFSLPYNTTAVTVQDLCAQIGLNNKSAIVCLDPATGVSTVISCTTIDAERTQFVVGEAVMILAATQKSFVPPVY